MRYEFLPHLSKIIKYAEEHQIKKDFDDAVKLFKTNPEAKSLNIERLEPKHLGFFSFRITKKYRATFVYIGSNIIKVVQITNHYR